MYLFKCLNYFLSLYNKSSIINIFIITTIIKKKNELINLIFLNTIDFF